MKVTLTPTSGAADLPEALIGAIMAAASDFRDAHISGSKNLKRTAHAELESTVRNTLHALAAGQATAQAAPENIRGILARCRDFIDTTKAPAYPAGADLADEIDVLLAAQPAPQPSHVAQAVVPAVEREQERIAFKDAHRHLDLDEVPDAWGRPMFKHSHVEASWLGWIARASHGQAPAETGNSVSAQTDSVQEDAALWHWLAEYLVGTRTDLDDEIVASETVNDLRKLVKAAIKQGANHDR